MTEPSTATASVVERPPTLPELVDMLAERIGLPEGFRGEVTIHVRPGKEPKPEVRWFPELVDSSGDNDVS